MPFPGFSKLYSVADPIASRPFRGRFAPADAALALSRAELSPAPIATITWDSGAAEPSPVVWTTYAHPVIVHAKVIDILVRNKLTGWGTYTANVFDRSGKESPDYFGLAITGRCDRVDLSRSSVVVQEYPGGWYPHFQGFYFTPDSWDGTDLFMERADEISRVTSYRFATERVVRALKREGVRNLEYERLTEKSTNTSVFTIGSAHLLPLDFEDRVASAYRTAGVPRPGNE